MAFILNIETATKNCSVSIAENGETISVSEVSEENYSHAEKLHVFIHEVIQQAGITLSELSAVAVSQGPGSYTGLRIGVSAAKGLCYALQIPLISVNTLESLSRKINIDNGVIIPMIDARRMEVYSAIYNKNHILVRETKAEIITENSFQEINGDIHLIGDGIQKCKEILSSEKFIFHDNIIYPSANQMSKISFDKYKISDTVNVAYFEPFYLKDFMLK